jgi:hypothetical protein
MVSTGERVAAPGAARRLRRTEASYGGVYRIPDVIARFVAALKKWNPDYTVQVEPIEDPEDLNVPPLPYAVALDIGVGCRRGDASRPSTAEIHGPVENRAGCGQNFRHPGGRWSGYAGHRQTLPA